MFEVMSHDVEFSVLVDGEVVQGPMQCCEADSGGGGGGGTPTGSGAGSNLVAAAAAVGVGVAAVGVGTVAVVGVGAAAVGASVSSVGGGGGAGSDSGGGDAEGCGSGDEDGGGTKRKDSRQISGGVPSDRGENSAVGLVEGSRAIFFKSTVVLRWSTLKARLRTRKISYRAVQVHMNVSRIRRR